VSGKGLKNCLLFQKQADTAIVTPSARRSPGTQRFPKKSQDDLNQKRQGRELQDHSQPAIEFFHQVPCLVNAGHMSSSVKDNHIAHGEGKGISSGRAECLFACRQDGLESHWTKPEGPGAINHIRGCRLWVL
jgi:hypothetical protein